MVPVRNQEDRPYNKSVLALLLIQSEVLTPIQYVVVFQFDLENSSPTEFGRICPDRDLSDN
jgi:hypothetical protein